MRRAAPCAPGPARHRPPTAAVPLPLHARAFARGALLALFASPRLSAQAAPSSVPAVRAVLEGRVVDAATGEALSLARVRLLELHREVTTHGDGTFRFTEIPPGRVTLVAQRLGYAPQTRGVDVGRDDGPVVFALAHAAAALAATVVTGTVDERPADAVIGTTTVVSGAALDRRLDATVSATLAQTPGFVSTSMGPATARPVLRGLGGDRVLVLEDGLRPGDLSATSSDHATAIEPMGAKQLEVVRGPMSLLYGPNALGGVVNVVQDAVPTSRPDDTHGTLSLQGGTAQPGTALGGVMTGSAGRQAWRAELTARGAGDLRTPSGTMGNTGLAAAGGALGISRITADGHAGLAVRGYASAYGLPGGFTGAHPDGVDLRMARVAVRAERERHPEGGRVTSWRVALQASGYAHQEIGGGGEVATSFQQQLTALEAVVRHGAWGPAASGAVGMRAQGRVMFAGGAVRTPDVGDWGLAGFAVQEYGRGRLRAQAGLRYDVSSFHPLQSGRTVLVGTTATAAAPRAFGAFSGAIGGLVEPVDGVRIGAQVARAFRTPDAVELYSDGPHLAAYSYDVGNPGLRPETGTGVEAFARVSGGAVQAEVAAFSNRLDGYIYARNTGLLGRQGFAPLFQYVNTDADFRGADGSVSWSVTPRWVLEGTLSAVYARRRGVPASDTVPSTATPTDTFPRAAASPYLPWIPPLQGTVGTRWESRRWFGGATLRAAARQGRTGDYERPTDGFAVVQLVAGARLLVGARLHTVTLRIDNAGNTLYRDHLSRTKVVLPEAGRNVSLLYRIAF